MKKVITKGKVIFAGAGPGDPDLITVKAVQWLQKADVVLVDRLVSPTILSRYVHPGAAIIPVGKQAGSKGSTPQVEINALLVQLANEGKLVVRLKGGDVSVFSNIFDELRAMVANQIPFEIVPGVTAALGGAAFAGIPLTARGYTTAIRFLTFYNHTTIDADYWKGLCETEDTLVFYMSSQNLDELVEHFAGHPAASERSMAIIEQATTPFQKVYLTTCAKYAKEEKGRSFLSPALVIMGKVTELHNEFAWWLPEQAGLENYFEPIKDPVADLSLDKNTITYHAAGK